MLRFFRIADNTFKESIREPVYFLMLLCALVLIAHFPSMALFVFFEQLKLVVDSSMATSLFFGLLCAVLCASNTVSRELRNGSVLLLLSKPVARPVFILAKIAGIVVAAGLFSLICNISSYISIYIAQDQFRLDMGAYAVFMIILGVGCVAGTSSVSLSVTPFWTVSTTATAVSPTAPSRPAVLPPSWSSTMITTPSPVSPVPPICPRLGSATSPIP